MSRNRAKLGSIGERHNRLNWTIGRFWFFSAVQPCVKMTGCQFYCTSSKLMLVGKRRAVLPVSTSYLFFVRPHVVESVFRSEVDWDGLSLGRLGSGSSPMHGVDRIMICLFSRSQPVKRRRMRMDRGGCVYSDHGSLKIEEWWLGHPYNLFHTRSVFNWFSRSISCFWILRLLFPSV